MMNMIVFYKQVMICLEEKKINFNYKITLKYNNLSETILLMIQMK